MKRNWLRWFSAILLLASLPACAGDSGLVKRTANTYHLAPGAQPGSGTLEQVAWLVGSWRGEAFGDRFEEVWNPASNGSMVGMFKLLKDDGVAFYEILLLAQEGDTLSLKVKHFNPDFTAWEEKSDYVNFRLVKLEPDAAHFSGISFYRRDADTIDGYLAMRYGEELKEEKLVYRRSR